MPPLRWLFTQPDNVVFYDVEIGEKQAMLDYRLKESRGFAAGLGVGPGWNGFFCRSFSSGKLTVDLENATVLEHRIAAGLSGDESVETFSDYVSVGDGYAARAMRIQSGNFDFRLQFKIHNECLWLLDRASHGDNVEPVLRIENVSVLVAEKHAETTVVE